MSKETASANILLAGVKRIVIKIGSKVLVDSENKGVNLEFIARLAGSVAKLRADGREIAIVSSGAVGEGMARLGYVKKPENMADKQACAAVGQIDLMHAYRNAFEKEGMKIGQILISSDDFKNEERSENIQNVLDSMLRHGIIPVINENDSVAVAEIKFGDNDKLSSKVARFWSADLLLLFTDEDGLFDSNPKTNPKAKLLPLVEKVTSDILELAKPDDAGSAVSTGGMRSKLEAVKAAVRCGCKAFLANGTKILPSEVLHGNAVGTLFLEERKKFSANISKKWNYILKNKDGFERGH